MDVTTLLESDHRRVAELFRKIEATRTPQMRETIYADIRREIESHGAAEEAVLYPVARRLAETEALGVHSEKEHARLRGLLKTLDSLDVASEGFTSNLRALKDAVDQHVAEEEGILFPKLRAALSLGQLDELGRRTGEARQGLVRATG